MRVIITARCKSGKYAPFIQEQVEALEKKGIQCQYFGIHKRGISGYLSHLKGLLKTIDSFRPDIIHAHYGLCGILANLQRSVPVVTTYHGSDINDKRLLRVSKWAIRFSSFNIFVSQKNIDLARPKSKFMLIPCGINLEDYPIIEKEEARRLMGLRPDGRYILFAGAFDNKVKNSPLAQKATERLSGVKLLELKGYSRAQVANLMQAVDVLLMTSLTEGSPQVIKEAMACGCPIVSVDVGDVKDLIEGIEGCYISERTPEAIASCLTKAIEYGKRTDARNTIVRKGLTNNNVSDRIINVYNSLV